MSSENWQVFVRQEFHGDGSQILCENCLHHEIGSVITHSESTFFDLKEAQIYVKKLKYPKKRCQGCSYSAYCVSEAGNNVHLDL